MIELKHVSKTYDSGANGGVDALKDVSLTIEDGDIYGIIGMSGAGKSTLVRCINLLERPTKGEIIVDGQRLDTMTPAQLRAARRNITMIFQHFNLLMQRTCLRNVCFPMEISGVKRADAEKRGRELLELVGLPDKADAYPAQLSGGQQQRVAIARALVNNPKVLLLDEPLGALDYQLRKNLQLELKNLQRGLGLTFIYVTHDQEEALTMSDRIVVMNKGVIEQDDNPDTIYHYPNTRFVAKFIGESNFFETESETLVIRPEKLNLCPEYEDEQAEKQHPEPGYYGTVVDVVFYGTIDKVFIRLDNSNQTVVAYQYFDDVKRWSPDERVGIWWYKKDEVKVSR